MQTILREEPNISSIFDDFDRLYAEMSEIHPDRKLIKSCYPKIFQPLVQMFEYNGYTGSFNIAYNALKPPKKRYKGKEGIILCFSGGKDSTAVAEHYLKAGQNLILYHMKGINQTYRDEWENAKDLAEYLKVPIVFDEVKLSGHHSWIEHPMKNMIIANGALQYAVRKRLSPTIAFGNFSTSSLDSDPFEVCGGDCMEMWDIYQKIIKSIYPTFKLEVPLDNFQDSIDILKQNPEIILKTQSCIGPYRYRNKLNQINQQKYHMNLKQNRCGSCWKCCLEYCVFCDEGIYDYNDEYYKHCLEILKNTLYKETGIKYNENEVWNHYFFYEKDHSRYYGNGWNES